MTLEQELEAGLAQLGLELSAEQIDRLNQYLALLNKWNKTYNLTAVRFLAGQRAGLFDMYDVLGLR